MKKSLSILGLFLFTFCAMGAGLTVSSLNGVATNLTQYGTATNLAVAQPSAGTTNVIGIDSTGHEVGIPAASFGGGGSGTTLAATNTILVNPLLSTFNYTNLTGVQVQVSGLAYTWTIGASGESDISQVITVAGSPSTTLVGQYKTTVTTAPQGVVALPTVTLNPSDSLKYVNTGTTGTGNTVALQGNAYVTYLIGSGSSGTTPAQVTNIVNQVNAASGVVTATNTVGLPVKLYDQKTIFIQGGSSFDGTYIWSNLQGTSGTVVNFWTNASGNGQWVVATNAAPRPRSYSLQDTSAKWLLTNGVSATFISPNLVTVLPYTQGSSFFAVGGTGSTPMIFAKTNSIIQTNTTFSTVNANDPTIVYCHTNSSFTYQGLTTMVSNSLSTGVQEACALGYPIALDTGMFPCYVSLNIPVPMYGQGLTNSGLVYFGTNDNYTANALTACFTLTGDSYHDMYFMSNTNAPISVVKWSPFINTGKILNNWFGWWFWATNNGFFSPDKPGNNNQQNLIGLNVIGLSSDDIAVEHNHFTDVIGASLTSDHGTFQWNTMDFCQPTGGNLWPSSSPYATGARVYVLAGGNGNNAWNIRDNWLLGIRGFDYFMDMTSASEADIISENDVGEGNPDTFVLIATNSCYQFGSGLSWTALNPNAQTYGTSMHGYYCNLSTPTVTNIIPDSGLVCGNGAVVSFNIRQLRAGFVTYPNAAMSAVNIAPNSIKMVVNASTSGTVTFSEPFSGASYKKIVILCSAALGTASFTFPTPFVNTPVVVSTSGLATTVVTSLSTTACTVTGTTTTGVLFIEGY